MAKRKAAHVVLTDAGDSPQSFVALWHWCFHRARQLSPRLPDDVRFDRQKREECFRDRMEVPDSDADGKPAHQFHGEFVAHLNRLKCDKSDDFPLVDAAPVYFRTTNFGVTVTQPATTLKGTAPVNASETVTQPLPPGAKLVVRNGKTWAEWTTVEKPGEKPQRRSGLTLKDKDGHDSLFIVTAKHAGVNSFVRLDCLMHRARKRCEELADDAGEFPKRWLENGDPPRRPVKTLVDLLKYLKELRATAMLFPTHDDEKSRSVERVILQTALERGVWWLQKRRPDIKRPTLHKDAKLGCLPDDLPCWDFDAILGAFDELCRCIEQAETLAGGEDAGGGRGEAVGKPAKLRPCDDKAWSQFRRAIEDNPELTTDQAAYDWFNEHVADEGETLPAFASWVKYIRLARAAAGEQKNKRGVGHETRSVVSAKRLDQRKRTKADRR